MDDLDGILARELNIQSKFGGNLDNLSDALSHVVILWTVITHFGLAILILGLITTISLLIRVTQRLDNTNPKKGGSPTNELMRHIFFVYILLIHFQINIIFPLAFILILHSVSLIAPFDLPFMIRSRSKSVLAIAFVNFLLIIAWVIPVLGLVIGLVFILPYLYSVYYGYTNWSHTSKIWN